METIPVHVFATHMKVNDMETLVSLMRLNQSFYHGYKHKINEVIETELSQYEYIHHVKITKNNTLFKLPALKYMLQVWDACKQGKCIQLPSMNKIPFIKDSIKLNDVTLGCTLKILLNTQITLANTPLERHHALPYQLYNMILIFKFIEWTVIDVQYGVIATHKRFIQTSIGKLIEALIVIPTILPDVTDINKKIICIKCMRYLRYMKRSLKKLIIS